MIILLKFQNYIQFLYFLNNSRFHWKKIGLIGRNTTKNNMKTLSQLIEDNGHLNENKKDFSNYDFKNGY